MSPDKTSAVASARAWRHHETGKALPPRPCRSGAL